MEMQDARKFYKKQDITIDDLWNMKHMFFMFKKEDSNTPQSTYEKIEELLTREAVMHEDEINQVLELIEEYGQQSFNDGESAVIEYPHSYGLVARDEDHYDI